MVVKNVSWDNSSLGSSGNLGSEEYISPDTDGLLSMRPFHYQADDSSDDCVESMSQENPFKDCGEKIEKIVFTNKGVKQVTTWTTSKIKKVPISSLVRSTEVELKRGEYNGEIITLPVVGKGRSGPIKRISCGTAAALLVGRIEKEYLLVDARYSYEYRGGHIRGAINVNDECELWKLLGTRKIVIFYCEFSSVRGPNMAQKLRELDRQVNLYPSLSTPEIYVLDGGYSMFYKMYFGCCEPCSYVKMHDQRYAGEYTEEFRKRKCVKK